MKVCDACLSPNDVGRVSLSHAPLGRGQKPDQLDEAELCSRCRREVRGRLRDLFLAIDLVNSDEDEFGDYAETEDGNE